MKKSLTDCLKEIYKREWADLEFQPNPLIPRKGYSTLDRLTIVDYEDPDWLYENDRAEYERQKQEMIDASKLKEKLWR